MTALSTDARQGLAQLLEGTGRRVHAYAPGTPVPPCYVLRADTPWMVPARIGGGLNMTLGITVLVVADARNGEAGLVDVEEATEAAIDAVAGTWRVVQASAPQLMDVNAGSKVLVAEIALTAHVKE